MKLNTLRALLVILGGAFLVPSCQEAPVADTGGKVAGGAPTSDFIAKNVDWQGLDVVAQLRATQIMARHACGCGRWSIAECRRSDPACPKSTSLSKSIVAGLKTGKSDADLTRELALAPVGNESIERVRVDLTHAPTLGPDKAPITIVEFIDYKCPFCQRAHGTVEQLRQRYTDRVRFAFKQNPLRIHPGAEVLAEAVLAAAAQGKFHLMHNRVMERRGALTREELVASAGELGLDVAAFRKALDSGRFVERVKADMKEAERLGAMTTPFFLVNGRPIRGAEPMPEFEKIIEAELTGNLPPTRWVEAVPLPPVIEPPPLEDPNQVYTVDVEDSLARGPKKAPVTIVEFTDYQCPFCARLHKTLEELLPAYEGKIRLVSKNLPLNIHPRAVPAAVAALAASKQGKFWEYRHLLFERQTALEDVSLQNYARELGLNTTRFETDLQDAADLQAIVDRDMKQAADLGLRSTPVLFINGRKFSGALPIEALKAEVDRLLSKPTP